MTKHPFATHDKNGSFPEIVYDLFKHLNKQDETNDTLDDFNETNSYKLKHEYNLPKKIVKAMREVIDIERKKVTDIADLTLEEWGHELYWHLPKKLRGLMDEYGIDPVDEAENFFTTHSVRVYALSPTQFMIMPYGSTSHIMINLEPEGSAQTSEQGGSAQTSESEGSA